MVQVLISCHAKLQALQNRYEEIMLIKLVSLESVRIASDSYALLRYLIEQRSGERSVQCPQMGNLIEWRCWKCPQIDLLSLVAGVALELLRIKHDLYPLLVVQEAELEGGFLKTLLLLKNSGVALVRLAKDIKEIVERRVESLDEEDEEDVLLGKGGKVEKVGKVVKNTADLVLEGTHDIAWLQARLPPVLEDVCVLLSTQVHFPDPDA